MKDKKYKNYILFWLSQAVSQLGSSMTGYSLIIWAYKQTGSAMAVSLLTFCSYLPYILASVFAGAFVDRHRKKPVLIWTDSISAVCSLSVAGLLLAGRLEIWHIYIVNTIVGFMHAFQSPAALVAVGILVPKEKYAKVSGMNSFSTSLIAVVTPMLAAFVSSFWGLQGVMLIDLGTFTFAILVCVLMIYIPEPEQVHLSDGKNNVLAGCKEGLEFLYKNKGLLYIMISLALLNFFSRLTYENILPAMLLSRSGGNNNVYGFVSGMIGFGGVAGGIIVTLVKLPENNVKLIYFSAAISFLFGDLLMGAGQNVFVWSIAALAASVPVSFISAGQNVILYNTIPKEMQGRVFAARNALQYFTIPIGILLGGALADYVHEPFMQTEAPLSAFLHNIVGAGSGSGMAVMFLCTGILGFGMSIIWYCNKEIQKLAILKTIKK